MDWLRSDDVGAAAAETGLGLNRYDRYGQAGDVKESSDRVRLTADLYGAFQLLPKYGKQIRSCRIATAGGGPGA